MPLPAIIGFTALSSFFASLFGKIIDFFVVRSIGGFLQAAALIALVVTAVNFALNGITSGLAEILALLPAWPEQLVPLFFPASVAKNCLLIVITGEIIVTYSMWSVWLYKLGKKSFRR